MRNDRLVEEAEARDKWREREDEEKEERKKRERRRSRVPTCRKMPSLICSSFFSLFVFFSLILSFFLFFHSFFVMRFPVVRPALLLSACSTIFVTRFLWDILISHGAGHAVAKTGKLIDQNKQPCVFITTLARGAFAQPEEESCIEEGGRRARVVHDERKSKRVGESGEEGSFCSLSTPFKTTFISSSFFFFALPSRCSSAQRLLSSFRCTQPLVSPGCSPRFVAAVHFMSADFSSQSSSTGPIDPMM